MLRFASNRPAAWAVWLSLTGAVAPASEPSFERARAAAQAGQHAEAAGILEQLIAANPFDGRLQGHLAFSLSELKDNDRSVAAFGKAIELGYSTAGNRYNQACLLVRAGRLDEAAQALEAALSDRFEDDELLRTDPDLQPLRDEPRFAHLFGRKLPADAAPGDRWAADLEYLRFRMTRLHWDLYRKISPAALQAEFDALQKAAAHQSDVQTAVGLRKLLASIGDGHTLLVRGTVAPIAMAPLELYWYTDGLFVRGAPPEQRDLIGKRVVGVGPLTTEQAFEAAKPYCSVDNPMGYLDWTPLVFRHPPILTAIGARSPDATDVEYRIEFPDGVRPVKLTPVVRPEHGAIEMERLGEQAGQAPLYRRNPDKTMWFEHLAHEHTVYFCLRAIADGPDQTLGDFCDQLFAFIAEHDVRHLVLDLRENGGGDSGVILSLLHGLIRCEQIRRPDGFFVIIGRRTFSAAMNLTSLLELHLRPVFVGEPTGSSPNFVGESSAIRLPNSGYDVWCSSRYWQHVVSHDRRIWIAPEIVAQPSSADAMAGRDPALEAILARVRGQAGGESARVP